MFCGDEEWYFTAPTKIIIHWLRPGEGGGRGELTKLADDPCENIFSKQDLHLPRFYVTLWSAVHKMDMM